METMEEVAVDDENIEAATKGDAQDLDAQAPDTAVEQEQLPKRKEEELEDEPRSGEPRLDDSRYRKRGRSFFQDEFSGPRYVEKIDPQPVDRWRDYIIRLGDKVPDPAIRVPIEEQLPTCAAQVKYVLESHSKEVMELILQCVEELPHKGPFYATMLGLLRAEHSEFVEELVGQVISRLQDSLDNNKRSNLRILLRFFTSLMANYIIPTTALVDAYNVLLSSAMSTVDEELGKPIWQPRADFYVFCVLAALPFGGEELGERARDDLQQIMAGVEAYMNLRKHISEPALWPFRVFPDGRDPAEEEDFLEDLWTRVKALQENDWKLQSVPKPHMWFDEVLTEMEPVSVSQSLMAPPVPETQSSTTSSHIAVAREQQQALATFPRRRGRVHIFPASKTDDLVSPIDRFLVEEYLEDVLFFLNGCRRECAAYMAGLPVTFRYEYLMAEVVFGQMLLLPSPPFKTVYYTVVLVDLCKALPGAFPSVVAGAVRALFARVADMDIECRSRLAQWLAHHLSNFKFVWPWDEWEYVVGLPPWSPHRVFAAEVLDKEVRLAYHQKIKETVQSSPRLFALLPSKTGPSYKYAPRGGDREDDEEEEGGGDGGGERGENHAAETALATELTGLIREKKSAREVELWLDERVVPTHGARTALVITALTLLSLGAKSFTHTVTGIERYGQTLRKLAPDQASQAHLVGLVAQLWRNSAQMSSIVIDRLMGYRIVSNLAIIDWVFTPACSTALFHTTESVWEILHNAIRKTCNRTADLRKQTRFQAEIVVAAREKVERARAKVAAVDETIVVGAQGGAEGMEDDQDLAGLAVSQAQKAAVAKREWLSSLVTKAEAELANAEEDVAVKQVLLERALREQESLFLAVVKKFAEVYAARAESAKAAAGPGGAGPSEAEDKMAADGDESAAAVPGPGAMMDIDMNADAADADASRNEQEEKEEGPKSALEGNSAADADKAKKELAAGAVVDPEAAAAAALWEQEEKYWRESTLGHLRALCRLYASEVWPLVEKLQREALTDSVDPLVVDAVYSGLGFSG